MATRRPSAEGGDPGSCPTVRAHGSGPHSHLLADTPPVAGRWEAAGGGGRRGAAGGNAGAPRAAARTAFTLAVGRAMGAVVVTARGDLDGDGSRVLRAVLGDLIDGQGNLDVVVDLRGVGDSCPSSVDAFAASARSAARRGGTLRLAEPPESMADALRGAGLGGLIRP